MEQQHQPVGEELALQPLTRADEDRLLPVEESHDERVIREGIEAAIAETRPIDDRTARYIAGQLHDGQASALYGLASSGAIGPTVFDELDRDRVQQPATVRWWIACLTVYCAVRSDRGPVEGWAVSAAAEDVADSDEADDVPWTDATRWRPGAHEDVEAEPLRSPFTDEELDEVFGQGIHEEIGDVAQLGWFGRLLWDDRPGGLIHSRDADGRRQTWIISTDEILE